MSGPTKAASGGPTGGPWWQRALREIVGWFLRRLYTNLAWAYDGVAHVTSIGQWWTWQTALDEALPAGRLLELGVGTGRLMQRYLSEGRRAIGIEASPQMATITRRRLAAAGLPPALAQARAQALPFAAGAFQALYATFPSDYILQPETLSEAVRVLKDGGEIIIVPGAWITGPGLLDRWAEWLYRLTGQSLPPDPAGFESIDVPGLEIDWEIVEQPRARVLRLQLRPTEDRAGAS